MKVLVIGSGGREHAFCWKIAKSELVDKIYAAPGNGGIASGAEIVDIKADDIYGLLTFAKEKEIDLTVVGPEIPLALGIVDRFNKENLKVFGPSLGAAKLESSKVFAKEVMEKANVPTAKFEVFDNSKDAFSYIDSIDTFPIVIKADGLCAGKGVIIANSLDEAKEAIKQIMDDKIFGQAGDRVIVEECLRGEEASILVLTDGKTVLNLATSQDHKRIFDGDKGPNTGGMGAYSPTGLITDDLQSDIMKKVINPVILQMEKENASYKGVLYAGIMVTENGPFVLEFNVRFGDPETQVVLPRLEGDLLKALIATIDGTLDKASLGWDKKSCVSVVVASGGYPGSYEKGKEITGLDKLEDDEDAVVFHAGTKKQDDKIVTSGGRVLNVTAKGDTIQAAREKAYKAIENIHFDNMYFRKDIGSKELKRRPLNV